MIRTKPSSRRNSLVISLIVQYSLVLSITALSGTPVRTQEKPEVWPANVPPRTRTEASGKTNTGKDSISGSVRFATRCESSYGHQLEWHR
jgi:hypothetical protein